MKRWLILAILFVVGGAAIFVAQRKKVDTAASPDAIVHFIGSSEQELTRLPMQLTALSDDEEIRIGDELAKNYVRATEGKRDLTASERDSRDYIAQVGVRVAAHTHRKLPYRFHYIPDPYFVNAFAIPGGHVFIGQGLIDLMDSEDELAAVLGHEVEHIDLGHAVERVQVQARLRHLRLGAVGALASLPLAVMQAGYSKDQEFAADREGTKLSVLAGYSPEGAIRMFETFDRFEKGDRHSPDSPQEEMAGVILASLSEYFRTHPPSAERADAIQRLIADQHWTAKPETNLKIAYVRWNSRARAAFDQHKYQQTIQYAKRSLETQPRQIELSRLVARSQFMLADFAAAAQTYSEMVAREPNDEDARACADALAASRTPNAWKQYETLTRSVAPNSDRMAMLFRVDRAGLGLLNHDESLTQDLDTEILKVDKDYTPEMLARLGWWYYRAGNYEKAFLLIDRASQMRPQDETFSRLRAWPLIELSRFRDISAVSGNQIQNDEYVAALAVSNWLSLSRELSLTEFTSLSNNPAWTNRTWVEANYSPLVAQTLDQIKQESQRRKKLGKS